MSPLSSYAPEGCRNAQADTATEIPTHRPVFTRDGIAGAEGTSFPSEAPSMPPVGPLCLFPLHWSPLRPLFP